MQTTKDLIFQRLNVEDDSDQSIETIKTIITATNCSELLTHSVAALKLFLNIDDHSQEKENNEKIQELVGNICEQWPILNMIPLLNASDSGCKYFVLFRKMFVEAKGLLQWLLGVFLVFVPQKMGTEKIF